MARILAGEALPDRDHRIPYNGAEGLPIREEIVARHGAAVVTRNSYGARCLNTENVLFADIDFEREPPLSLNLGSSAAVLVLAAATWFSTGSLAAAIAVATLGLVLQMPLVDAVYRALARSGFEERRARARILAFSEKHPDWNLRIYRTPAGMRVMATHRTFDPAEDEAQECLRALGTDPVYVRMCLNQRCFRARLSPKPWRIGISAHMRPRPGVWPVAAERMPERSAWIARYEAAAAAFAACRYVESLGSGHTDSEVRAVRDLHDESSGATSGRPIA